MAATEDMLMLLYLAHLPSTCCTYSASTGESRPHNPSTIAGCDLWLDPAG